MRDFQVSGRIVEPDGSGVEGIDVKAFDKELRAENLLGEAATDHAGQYFIRYSRDQLSRPDKTSADLIVLPDFDSSCVLFLSVAPPVCQAA